VANYLLGDEALLAFLHGRHVKQPSKEDAKFAEWAKNLGKEDFLFASRMSAAVILASIERINKPARRDATRKEIESRLASFKDSLIDIDETILKQWAVLRANQPDPTAGAVSVISAEQNVELATALTLGYTLVTRGNAELTKLQSDNPALQIIDPWV